MVAVQKGESNRKKGVFYEKNYVYGAVGIDSRANFSRLRELESKGRRLVGFQVGQAKQK